MANNVQKFLGAALATTAMSAGLIDDAIARDASPSKVPAFTDAVPSVALGGKADGNARIVLSGRRPVAVEGACGPEIVIVKNGTDSRGTELTIFSSIPTTLDRSELYVVPFANVKASADVNGDLLYDFKNNNLRVDSDFVRVGAIQSDVDEIKLQFETSTSCIRGPSSSTPGTPGGGDLPGGGCQSPPCGGSNPNPPPANDPEDDFNPNADAEKIIIEQLKKNGVYQGPTFQLA